MATAREVAEWMLDKLREVEYLDQETAAFDIERRFGSEFVYQNENGNPAYSPRSASGIP